MKNSHIDFASLAMRGLNKKEAVRVGIALDCAIIFGVLEYLDSNESLYVSRVALQALYNEKLERLRNA
jgi:hypothetical protein